MHVQYLFVVSGRSDPSDENSVVQSSHPQGFFFITEIQNRRRRNSIFVPG